MASEHDLFSAIMDEARDIEAERIGEVSRYDFDHDGEWPVYPSRTEARALRLWVKLGPATTTLAEARGIARRIESQPSDPLRSAVSRALAMPSRAYAHQLNEDLIPF